ncbi:hypothetical protein BGW38_006728 [Lunasporangiospora selenospora]|uniref:Asn/Gln amidotransferase domain-containing protein n=1 Tax=Lunasporangiospora selenospora TaxID=979761 RepID=A0A9P6KG58_9FUNG|nr:hypothetical protein BGW38_006728 [Lunasporangiospora selenospora]
MDEGSMRCDVNVSVREVGQPFGSRCELKNLNSIKSVVDAIDAEIVRQIASYESNEPVNQETRGYDVSTGKTFRIRTKEGSPDYRYMPEPDLPPLVLSKEWIQGVKNGLPELPDVRRDRIMSKYHLTPIECNTMMGEQGMVEYFEQVVEGRSVKNVASWLVHELLGRLHTRGREFGAKDVSVSQFGSLIDCFEKGLISAKIGKSVLNLMIEGDTRDAEAIVMEKGWQQLDNRSEMEKLCEATLSRHPDKVKALQAGSVGLLGFFVGQIMKESKGRANPVVLSQILKEKLGVSDQKRTK